MSTQSILCNFFLGALLSVAAQQPASASRHNKARTIVVTGISPAPELNILYCNRKDFLAIYGRKTVFKYLISSGDLVMAGWHVKGATGHGFQNKPNLVLNKSSLTQTVTWDAETYIGNVQLTKKEIKVIKNIMLADKSLEYVLFIPKPDSLHPHHVAYDIMLSTINSASEPAFDLKGFINLIIFPEYIKGTGVEANPSPPRKYSKF